MDETKKNKSLFGLGDRLRSMFQPKMRSPLPQPIDTSPGPGYRLLNNPVMDQVVRAQNFIESPKSFRVVPEIKAPTNATPVRKVVTFAANIPGQVVNTVVGQGILNPLSDVGRLAGRTIRGEDVTDYNQLKSAPARLAYNITGRNRNAQQVVGNVAGSVLPVIDAYGGGKVFGIGKKAVENVGKQGIKAVVKNAVKEGAVIGGVSGGLQGASESRNKTAPRMAADTAVSAGVGALFGSVISGGSAAAGAYMGKIRNAVAGKVRELNPQFNDSQVEKITSSFIRDELGRFSKSGKQKVRFVKDPYLQESDIRKLRQSLDLPERYDYGFIKVGKDGKKSYKAPYKKGDIDKLTKELDYQIGFDPNSVHRSRVGFDRARMMTEFSKLADTDPSAKPIMDYADQLNSDIETARADKNVKWAGGKNAKVGDVVTGKGKVVKITKSGQQIFEDVKPKIRVKKVNVQNPDGTLRSVPEDQVKPNDVVIEDMDVKPTDPFIQELDDYNKNLGLKAEKNKAAWEKQTGNTPSLEGAGKPPSGPPPDLINPEDFAQEAGRAMESAKGNKKLFSETFARWIGKREAAGTTALQKAEQFRNIPQDKATQVIDAIEYPGEKVDGDIKQYAQQFKTEYDALFKEAKDAGVDINYLKNYITHIWDRPVEEVKQMYKSLGTKFQFAKEREVPTYREGIQMGLVPKYTQPSQILAAYVDNLEKVKANLTFINELKKNNLVVSAATARNMPGMFKPLTGPGFPQSKSFNAEGTTMGPYYAPAEVADVINRVFDEQNTGLMGIAAKASGVIQDISMSGGLPKTPLNAWTIAQMTKEITAGRLISPIQAFFRSTSGKASDDFFRANLGQIKKMQEQNIPVQTTVDIDSFLDKGTLKKMFGGSVPEAWNKFMNEPTFKRFMPQLQIQFFNDIEKQALRAGKSSQEAAQIAGKAVKNFYGVTGSDTLAKRSQMGQDLATTFLFAPRYRESMINFWVNNIKSLANPLALENRNNAKFMVGGLLTLYAMNKINEQTMEQPMSENGPGKEDKLLIPLEDGTVLGIPFMSSIATMPRMIYRMGMSAKEGDFAQAGREARGLLSQMVRPPVDILANENYFGQEIVGENDTPQERFRKQGVYLSEQYNHPYYKFLTGQQIVPWAKSEDKQKEPLYQSVLKAMEAPTRFYSQKSIDASKYYAARKEALKSLNEQELKAFESIPKSEGDPLNSMYKYQTYARYPKTFQVQREIALRTAEKTGQSVDPLFLIPDDLARRYIASASLAPGDPEKSDMYKAFPELAEFVAIRSEYFDATPFPEQEGKNINATRPQPSPYVQSQMDVKNWKDPQVQAYLIAKDEWNNSQRERLGLLPIGEPGAWGKYGKRKPTIRVQKASIPEVSKVSEIKTGLSGRTPKIKLKSARSIRLNKQYQKGTINIKV